MHRLLNVAGRAALELDGRHHDLARAAGDESLSDPMAAIARHRELGAIAAALDPSAGDGLVSEAELLAPSPSPRQVFAIGLNYADHAAESGQEPPPAPLTFTKFPSSVSAPCADVALSGDMVDWEVEVVAVVGDECGQVAVEDGWGVLAGLTLGQDISDRQVQLTGAPPQFSLGKSFATYAPVGPAIVSVDAFDDPDDLAISCEVSGEEMQSSRTSQLIFSIPRLVAYLSSVCRLEPGDLIFTGTPAGVGMGRGRFLVPGDVIVSRAEGIGEITNRCVAGTPPFAL